MKVLMSAYACEPNKGSEPGVGWHWALQAARFHEVWVLTRSNNRETIENELAKHPQRNLNFVYHDLPGWLRWWKRGQRGIQLYYLLWQLTAVASVHRLCRLQRFDIIHHVTMNTIDAPGFLWLLGRPFVWGPVGGAQVPPPALKAYFEGTWWRQVVRSTRKKLILINPLIRVAVHRASCVLVANADTERAIRSLGVPRVVRELETAVDLPPNGRPVRDGSSALFTILWSGGLIHLKAPLLALDAVAELRRRGVVTRMIIVGDGPLRQRVARHIRELDLTQTVELLGAVSYTAMQALYQEADVFLFTSLRDTSGNVVLEAMANSLPVVALNHHGAAEMVTKTSGILVPVATVSQVVDGLASALLQLARDPDLCCRLGYGGRQRVKEQYLWKRKGERICQIYALTGKQWR